MAEPPDLSVIIVNWNTRELLRKCLESVDANVPPLSFEVFVVDNASTDGSAEMIEKEFPQVLLIRNMENPGFAKANNMALTRSAGRYTMLLNPDTELKPGAVQAMMRFADAHPDAAVVGPKLLNSDGSLQKNGRNFPTVKREFLSLTNIRRRMPERFEQIDWGRDDFDVPAEVDEVCGACMFVRRAAIDQIGLLDEGFFMYYEEVDWCYRMKKAGWKVQYLPEAEVVHHGGAASDQIGREKLKIAFRSMFHFFRKHHGVAQALFLWAVSRALLVYLSLRSIVRRTA